MSGDGAILEITTTGDGLELLGEIDGSSVGRLGAHLDPLPGTDERVVLDMRGVEFIDSSGLRALIDAHQRAAAQGRRLVLSAPSSVVMRLFEIAGITGYLHIEP